MCKGPIFETLAKKSIFIGWKLYTFPPCVCVCVCVCWVARLGGMDIAIDSRVKVFVRTLIHVGFCSWYTYS